MNLRVHEGIIILTYPLAISVFDSKLHWLYSTQRGFPLTIIQRDAGIRSSRFLPSGLRRLYVILQYFCYFDNSICQKIHYLDFGHTNI